MRIGVLEHLLKVDIRDPIVELEQGRFAQEATSRRLVEVPRREEPAAARIAEGDRDKQKGKIETWIARCMSVDWSVRISTMAKYEAQPAKHRHSLILPDVITQHRR